MFFYLILRLKNGKENRPKFQMSAQVMEMTEKEQSDFVYEVLGDIYMTIKN